MYIEVVKGFKIDVTLVVESTHAASWIEETNGTREIFALVNDANEVGHIIRHAGQAK